MKKYFLISLITIFILTFISTTVTGETTKSDAETYENELASWRVTISPDYQEITKSKTTAKWKFTWSSSNGPFDLYFTPNKGMRQVWIGKYPSSGVDHRYAYNSSGPDLFYPSIRVIDYNGILAVGEAIVYKRP